MGHNHLKAIKTLRACNHYQRLYEDITDPVSSWVLLHPHPKDFPEGDKKWKLSYMDRPQQSKFVKTSTP